MYLKKLKIGNVELENNLILAPMAGVTDLPFRRIVEKFNPGLVCTEMVSSKALLYGDEKTKGLLKTDGEKRPISMQIFGSDIESMKYAAQYVSKLADILDINMGCPAPKVVKNGDGSKLLLDLEKAKDIMETVVKNSKVPVTLKFRKGWDSEHIVATEIAKIAQQAGISAITIHGRTRAEYYSGKADLEIIKKVKESVNIPVIGNGDVVDEESAKEMFEKTGVDGIMIGRASMGNPWIFKQTVEYLKTGSVLPNPTDEEKLDTIIKHLEMEIEEKGEFIAVREMRKHISAYTKNMKNSSQFRSIINTLESKEEVENALKEYFKNYDRPKKEDNSYEQLQALLNQDSVELSYYCSNINDYAFVNWNSSAYHTNNKGNLVIDRKLKVGFDVPKSVNMNIKIPTQKYKNRCVYSY